ncbi:hypothetical protein CTP45_07825 [Salmonella enterica]|uniref:Uncharacterized protein n=1 Tax=Salmonella enterica subsp. enterica serovar Saintpaul TaxID=90105 RepID=A0A5U9I4F9_SALET|nr:hypothetical protein [Salmonella enterica]EBS2301350.1 hypothetical protein [Salmonella enterica subsp. enterica serovar Saintpaul]EDW0017483.1 hypothetical protein [Salmonella enterica subsp. enterica serovar Aba]HCZ4727725.1 hypothetical protein [Salmonella enterica subsp. enterica serovar Saintpaul str. CFSAN004137]EAW8020495.1 hypothetical protein [Salmonella enterica]
MSITDVVLNDQGVYELAEAVRNMRDVVEVETTVSVQALTSKAVTILKAAIEANTSTKKVICLQDMTVDTFTRVSSYENNRDVKERAVKQAKKKGTHHTSNTVAIAVLDPERNAALWKRTQKVAEDQGIPHTLPFIKVDGHTRSYGWTTPDPKNAEKTLFDCPEYLLITVYRDQTDDQIHEIVHNYCDGVNKANNAELQQMGMKKVEFDPQSAFVKKDSWKTAFRTIDREHGKGELEPVIALYRKQLEAIDSLNVDTKNTSKKLSGVRAALITTYTEEGRDKWITFWQDFYLIEPQISKVGKLISALGELKTGDAKGAMDQCVKVFKAYRS